MGEQTAIAWTDHTFNPWWGCTRVSPGCQNCYAESFAKRTGNDVWGKNNDRRFFGDKHWAEPYKWDRKAREAGVIEKVFCASMADVFEDRPDLIEPRADLFKVIMTTPNLVWQLLTKRPENVLRLLPDWWVTGEWPDRQWHGPGNVWIGCTVEDQERAEERLPWLLDIPAPVRFVSCEPLLGPVDLTSIDLIRKSREADPSDNWPRCHLNALTGHVVGPDDVWPNSIDWVIVGGESGGKHRLMDMDNARRIVGQCEGTRDVYEWGVNERLPVPVFFKQVGGRTPTAGGDLIDGRQLKQFPCGYLTGPGDAK